MLKSQRKTSEQHQNQNGFGVPMGLNLGTSVNLVSNWLPQPSNGCCGSSRVGGHQIARSNGSSQVATLWKVSTLVLGGKERSVATRGNRTPCRVLLASNKQSQCPTGINSTNRIDWNLEGSENVDEQYLALANFNPRPIEHRPNGKNHQAGWGQAQCHTPESRFCVAGTKCQQHDGGNYPGNCFAEAGSKDLHIANDSLAPGVFA